MNRIKTCPSFRIFLLRTNRMSSGLSMDETGYTRLHHASSSSFLREAQSTCHSDGGARRLKINSRRGQSSSSSLFASTRCKMTCPRNFSTSNDNDESEEKKKTPRWPWIMAAISGLVTLYVSSSAQMDRVYRKAVEEIGRDQQILQGLQVAHCCNLFLTEHLTKTDRL